MNPQKQIERALGIGEVAGIGFPEAIRLEYFGTKEDKQAALAQAIGRAVIKRINYPKALAGKVSRKASLSGKSRPLLTFSEEQDVQGSVALVLITTGALERGKLTLNDWKLCFREVRGPNCLRIDREAKNQSEQVSIDSMDASEIELLAFKERLPELPACRRAIIAKKARELKAQVVAKFKEDTKRKRSHNFKEALHFLRFVVSQYGKNGWGRVEVTKGNDASAIRHKHQAFNQYAKDGALIIANREQSGLKSFAEIPSLYAVAD